MQQQWLINNSSQLNMFQAIIFSSSRALDCVFQFVDTGRQHRGCIIPQAVTHSLVLLKMGKIISRNMLS